MSSTVSTETPVMRQYLEAKSQYPDCILFFRLGDFYEMFYEDAVYAAQALDLTLTSRDKNKENPIPMCGVPHHAAKQYIARLIELGKKVALCEQLEDARLTKKMVRRAVTQVFTPGIRLEEEQLHAKTNNYLAAVVPGLQEHVGLVGIAYLDVSTGEFAGTQLLASEAAEELSRIAPAEWLWVEGTTHEVVPAHTALRQQLQQRVPTSVAALQQVSLEENQNLLETLLSGTPSSSAPPLALAAAGACIRYARSLQPTGELPLVRIRWYQPSEELIVDETTRRHLELVQTNQGQRPGSLLALLDRTKTAMGGRLLRRWLLSPSQNTGLLQERYDAIEWLVEHHTARRHIQDLLGTLHDLERLTGRLALQIAHPRDLARLGHSLAQLPLLVQVLTKEPSQTFPVKEPLPTLLLWGEDLCSEVKESLQQALVEAPPITTREGGLFRKGYHAELDELAELASGGKRSLLAMEERERARTGISSLKIQYNRVFGYYLEVTKAHLSKVPADYIRKQTLAQAERFITPELSEYEARILGAEERRLQLEEQLFVALREKLAPTAKRLFALATKVSLLDTLCSLADVAHHQGYVRPELLEEPVLMVQEGRHPVVEQLLPPGVFVPNDVQLDVQKEQLWLITGPNMAGKSTVMRQVALICILAQMGSFVPAKKARLGMVDRIFARVGATDNLSAGDSTFMVEMRETATILQHASKRSLVLLDEIGRGTSTYDGLSIAWAVAEYMHDVIGCKTLFATHYHELCALASSHPRVHNVSVAVRQVGTEVVFLHKLVSGAANRSYGIEVARLAGLPKLVLTRAKYLLEALESGTMDGQLPLHSRLPQLSLFPSAETAHSSAQTETQQKPALLRTEEKVLQTLRELDCDQVSPRQAFHLLGELTELLRSTQPPA